MWVSAIKKRLEESGLEQRELAAEVTESYVSQLPTRKKAPPQKELKRKLGGAPPPLFEGVRELVLRTYAGFSRSSRSANSNTS